MSHIDSGYIVLARGFLNATDPGMVAAPASGATITLWSSETNLANAGRGQSYKNIIVTLFTSHDSAVDGLKFEHTNDNAANWDTTVNYSVTASTVTIKVVQSFAVAHRVRYVNSANTLTAWRFCVLGDLRERAA